MRFCTTTRRCAPRPSPRAEALVDVRRLNLFYGDKQALFDISVRFPRNQGTAIIGLFGVRKEHPFCAPSTE